MKKLEDMNLMDDFLVSSLMNSREYGEKAVRYILGCILKRPLGKLTVVPQRVMCGESPENSTEENARTDSLKELHQMVRAVKSDGEVGISYMKSVEIEEKIREEGREEGMSAGIDIMMQAIGCAKTRGYTTADQLIQAGYDRKVAEAAIKCI